MKNRSITISKISLALTVLTSLVFISLVIIVDYDFQIEKALNRIMSSQDVSSILVDTALVTFFGSFILLWGLWRSTKKQKIGTVFSIIAVFFALLIRQSYPDFHYNYVVEENPYDGGKFIRDTELDKPQLIKLLKEDESLKQDGVVIDEDQPYEKLAISPSYISNLVSTTIRTEKYTASMYGRRDSMYVYYNVCLEGKNITFNAVKMNARYSDDYCQAKWTVTGDYSVKLTFEPINQEQFFCKGCEDYYLPLYWRFVKD